MIYTRAGSSAGCQLELDPIAVVPAHAGVALSALMSGQL